MYRIVSDEYETDIKTGIERINCGRLNDAILIFNKLIDHFPEDAKLYYYLGEAHFRNSDFKEAVENYNKSIDLNPTEMAFINCAISFGEMKQFEKSIETLKRALKIYKVSTDIYSYMGVALRSLNRPIEAIESFQNALVYNKDQLGANWGLGVTFGIIGDREGSIKYLNNAVNINPSFAPPYFHLAINYISLADISSAKEILNILNGLDPGFACFLRHELEKYEAENN
ncbi:MAG: tetratricopeptide repeat protein [Bacteroidetes bacterium]|nr:tetratricopeptide repeat protein [Bacteroidota bacterium]